MNEESRMLWDGESKQQLPYGVQGGFVWVCPVLVCFRRLSEGFHSASSAFLLRCLMPQLVAMGIHTARGGEGFCRD